VKIDIGTQIQIKLLDFFQFIERNNQSNISSN
jgi:hypothetical protein